MRQSGRCSIIGCTRSNVDWPAVSISASGTPPNAPPLRAGLRIDSASPRERFAIRSVAVARARILLAGMMLMLLAGRSWSIDSAAAEKLVVDSKCTKCHAIDRKKDGPAYRDVAAKFRAEADAETKVIHHITSGEMVKFPDGHQERHKKLKADDPADVKNVAGWILSLEGGKKY